MGEEQNSGYQVSLAALLRLHGWYRHPHVLMSVLGDPYLYHHSRLFANVRDAALAEGFTLSDQDCPVWREYRAMPLVVLQRILETRRIPIVDNVSVLERLRALGPPRLPLRFLVNHLCRNYVLHESSHCVAHAALARLRSAAPIHGDGALFVLENLLAESFANCTEQLVACLGASNPHILFFNFNSYMPFNPKKEGLMRSAVSELGLEAVAHFGVLAFFVSNVPARGSVELALGAAADWTARTHRLSAAAGETLRTLGAECFVISPSFRDETSSVYFSLFGLADEQALLWETLQMDRESWPENGTGELAGALSSVAVHGVPQAVAG